MAKYDVTHACGHTTTYQLVGPNRQREYRLGRLESEECSACRNARQNAESAEAAKKVGLPALAGTEKQIAWAETVRASLVKECGRWLVAAEQSPELKPLLDGIDPADTERVGVVADKCEEAEGEAGAKVAAVLRAFCSVVRGRTSASWWIDHRDESLRSLPTLLAREQAAAEEQRAKELKVEAIHAAKDAVRARLAELLPGVADYTVQIGVWSGQKRAYLGRGYNNNFATYHHTGNASVRPGTLSVRERGDAASLSPEQRESLRDYLSELCAAWQTLKVGVGRGEN